MLIKEKLSLAECWKNAQQFNTTSIISIYAGIKEKK